MAWKNETLHRGLHTAMDPAVAPEGSLQDATNARYRPNDPAIWQAEGRKTVADGLHGVNHSLQSVAGIQWDPGSGSELEQILFPDNDSRQLATVPALQDPADPGMNYSNAITYTTPTGVFPQLDSGILIPVQFENEHFILTGGDNLKFSRSSGTQTLYRHGMPATPFENTSGIGATVSAGTITVNTNTSAGTAGIDYLTIPAGFHWFWVTWYDSTNDIEGAVESGGAAYFVLRSEQSAMIYVTLDEDTFRNNWPANADSIRLYYSGAHEAELASIADTTARTNPWPTGYLLGTLTLDTSWLNNPSVYPVNYTILITKSTGTYAEAYSVLRITNDQLANPGLYYLNFADNVVYAGGGYANKFGEPPKASTGDVFEESLVLNDVDDLRKVKFSFAGDPDAFPSTFYINFETDDWDKVVAIRTLGNKLGVFMANSVWRINWLPSTSDLDFGRGRVKDLVVAGRGSFSHKSVARFSMRGQPLLAFVSRNGIYATDLYSETKLTKHVDWESMLDGRDPSEAILLDDPDNERLIFMLNNVMFYVHYDDLHTEGGTPAITGPVQRPNGIQAGNLIRLSNGRQQVINTGKLSPKMFYEGLGLQDEGDTTFSIIWGVKTRDIYPWSPGREGHIKQFQAHVKPSGTGAGEWTTRVNGYLSGTQAPVVKISPAITTSIRQLKSSTGRALIEFYNVEIRGTSTSASMAVNFIGVEGEDLDMADAR